MRANLHEQASRDPDLQALLAGAVAEAGAAEGSILLVETDAAGRSAGLRFAVSVSPHAEALRGRLVPPGKGLVGLCLAFQQPMAIFDVKSDPAHHSGVDEAVGSRTRSEAIVPISTPEREFGCLTAINTDHPEGFRRPELTGLEDAAARIADRLAWLSARLPAGGTA